MPDQEMEEPKESPPASDGPGRGEYLFSSVSLSSPIEELKAIFEKRFRTAQSLGEDEKARLYEAAHALARKRLGAALGEEA